MPVTYRKTLTVSAASTNGIATSQTPSGAADLTLVSSAVTLPNQGQRPQIVTLADLSNRTFTFYGTEVNTGRTMSRSMTGPNATTGIMDASFATVTRVAISGAAAGALTVGWAAQGDLGAMPTDARANPTDIGFSCVITTGTPTYTVRFTMNDVQDATANPGAYKWFDHPIVAALTSDNTGNFGKPVVAASLYASGVCTMDFVMIQGGQ